MAGSPSGFRSALAIGAAIALAACGGQGPTAPDAAGSLTPIASGAEWPAVSPADARIDASRIEDLVARIHRGQFGRISSLLVVREGSLVVEEYFNGMVADRAHTLQSVTKSVTSMLVGLAVQSGRLRLDDRVTRFFPDYQPIANIDDRKDALTIADLLTMRSGLDWDESTYAGSPLERLNNCRCDWLRFILDWRMRDLPGTRFEYISGGTILLGGVVGAATGIRLDRWASSELFVPLGISGESWTAGLPDSLPHAGGGLFMRPRDLAKLGLLVVDQGRWHGRQIIDANWLRLTTTRASRTVRTLGGRPADYGYGWWLLDYQGNDVIAAAGALGQWIFVVPSMRLVAVTTGANDDGGWAAPVEFLYSHILPATR